MDNLLVTQIHLSDEILEETNFYTQNQTFQKGNKIPKIIISTADVRIEGVSCEDTITIKSTENVYIKNCKFKRLDIQAENIRIKNSEIKHLETVDLEFIDISKSTIDMFQSWHLDYSEEEDDYYTVEGTQRFEVNTDRYGLIEIRESKVTFGHDFQAEKLYIIDSEVDVSLFLLNGKEYPNYTASYYSDPARVAEYHLASFDFVRINNTNCKISGILGDDIEVQDKEYTYGAVYLNSVPDTIYYFTKYFIQEEVGTLKIYKDTNIQDSFVNLTGKPIEIKAEFEQLTDSISSINEQLKEQQITIKPCKSI